MTKLPLCFLTFMFLALAGCGGGNSATTATAAPPTGIFSDAPVQGVRYCFGSYSGVTGPGGTFTYAPGTIGVFRLGDIELGRSLGKPVLTPMDLVENLHPAASEAQKRADALKLVQLLTSLGGGPGQSQLIIPPQLTQLARGRSYGSVDLMAADLNAVVSSLGNYTLTTTAAADSHLADSLANLSQIRHAGEYVSNGPRGDTVEYVSVDSQGRIFADLIDNTGAVIFASGVITSTGKITFEEAPSTITLPIDGGAFRNAGGSMFSGSGTSSGDGKITANISSPFGDNYRIDVTRVTSATSRFSGFYVDSRMFAGAAFNWQFCVDAGGNIIGAVTYSRDGNTRTVLHGKLDVSTGNFVLLGEGINFTGTISGSTVTGTLTTSTSTSQIVGNRQTYNR
jgi:hypothetical protein